MTLGAANAGIISHMTEMNAKMKYRYGIRRMESSEALTELYNSRARLSTDLGFEDLGFEHV